MGSFGWTDAICPLVSGMANNIKLLSAIYYWCGLFLDVLKKKGFFEVDKFLIFLGIKHEPLSDPSIIKISEWGNQDWDTSI